MTEPQFEWDDAKNRENDRKHGVGFEEASTVFRDQHALFLFDSSHSETEDRFLLLGFSMRLRMLVVAHCYRKDDNVIRIITARKATKNERIQYERKKS